MSRAACVDIASARGRRRTDFIEWMVFAKFAIAGGRRPAILASAGSIASPRASRGDIGVTPGAFVDRLTRRAEADRATSAGESDRSGLPTDTVRESFRAGAAAYGVREENEGRPEGRPSTVRC